MSRQADRIIALSAFGTFTTVFIDSFSDESRSKYGGFPSVQHAKAFVGAGLAFIGCAAIAVPYPSLGSAFAVLILATALTYSGGTAYNFVLNLVGD